MGPFTRPVFVLLVLVFGIGFFFIARKPHTVCDSQIEVFQEAQKGGLYPTEIKGLKRAPLYPRYLESCRQGNSPGACYEMFSLMKKIIRDLDASPPQCYSELAEVPPLKKVLGEQIELMALIAWGNLPPQSGAERFNWLETSDLALFCSLRRVYNQIFGEEDYNALRLNIHTKLPGEATVIREGLCVNCDSRKNASQVLSSEEIWPRSLFSIRCDQF